MTTFGALPRSKDTMKRKSRPSDILALPNESNYRAAVDQLIVFQREDHKSLKRKKLVPQHRLIEMLKTHVALMGIVIDQHESLMDKIRTYKDNCHRMDTQSK